MKKLEPNETDKPTNFFFESYNSMWLQHPKHLLLEKSPIFLCVSIRSNNEN